MERVARSELESLFTTMWLESHEVCEEYYKTKSNIERIVDDLYDVSEKVVYPLTERQTFVVRKLYGIFDDGQLQTLSAVAEVMGCTKTGVASLRNEGIISLRDYRAYNFNSKTVADIKMSSADLIDDDSIKNIKVSSLGLSSYALRVLKINQFFTINDLLTLSAQDLGSIIGDVTVRRVSGIIHGLGLKFIDELSVEEKRQIISNSSLDRVLASSISWIDMPGNIYEKLRCRKGNLGEVIELVKEGKDDCLRERDRVDISLLTEQAADIGFKFIKKDPMYDTFEETLERLVDDLDLSERTSNILKAYGYRCLGDMTGETVGVLLRMRGMGDKARKEVINAFHGRGLLFANDVYTIGLYTEAISEQLGSITSIDEFFDDQADALIPQKCNESCPVKIKNVNNG